MQVVLERLQFLTPEERIPMLFLVDAIVQVHFFLLAGPPLPRATLCSGLANSLLALTACLWYRMLGEGE